MRHALTEIEDRLTRGRGWRHQGSVLRAEAMRRWRSLLVQEFTTAPLGPSPRPPPGPADNPPSVRPPLSMTQPPLQSPTGSRLTRLGAHVISPRASYGSSPISATDITINP